MRGREGVRGGGGIKFYSYTSQDSLVLDTPRLRRQVRRYGNDSIEEIVEMNEAIDEVSLIYVCIIWMLELSLSRYWTSFPPLAS